YELVVLRPDETSGIVEGLKLDGWVHPAYRGRGLNRYMHQAGENWCRARGIRRMVSMIAAHNQSSLRATEKAGFQTVRVLRAKWL
ncbi:MAG: GNAT family N-acetyltransferase, partial [Bacillota bacterium]